MPLAPVREVAVVMKVDSCKETRHYVEVVMRNLWMYQLRDGTPAASMDALAAGLWPRFPGMAGAPGIKRAAMPVVTVAPNDVLLEKLKSNMQEVRARGGELFVFADADTRIESGEGLHVIRMPEHYGALSPILHVVPLQMLAYHTALAKGTDVDKPRNLAKSVTVE